jgi:hypothetical protein
MTAATAPPAELRARALLELCADFIERAEAKAQSGDGDVDRRLRFLVALDELRRVAERRPLRQAPPGSNHRHAAVDKFARMARTSLDSVAERTRELEWMHAALELDLARTSSVLERRIRDHRRARRLLRAGSTS